MCHQIQNTNTEFVIAFIGILGTVLGTVLGWILNNISQKGRLHFYVLSWKDDFSKDLDGIVVDSCKKEDVDYYSFSCFVDVYNSSAETKIMRNIEVVFANNKTELWCEIPDNYDTQRFSAGCVRYDKVEPINIPPKTVMKLSLHSGRWDKDNDLAFLWDVNRIFIRYTDEKNKKRKIRIKHGKMEDYLVKYDSEEE